MGIIDTITEKDYCFGLVVFNDSFSILDYSQSFRIEGMEIIYQKRIGNVLLPKTTIIQADPFLFAWNDKLYLFYESMKSGKKGIINMINTTDLKNWSKPINVLDETFHLSFPFVFEINGYIYMIPESEAADEIRLYKANNNITKFSYVKTLLKSNRTDSIFFNYSDSHVVLYNGLYFLFTSVLYKWEYHLELYYTDDLLYKPLKKHPKSPICISNKYGRSGGCILNTNNGLLRVAQNCAHSYGANISLLRITCLTPEDYAEEAISDDIYNPSDNIFQDGGHHLNTITFKGSHIFATDYRRRKWCWYQRYTILKDKLKNKMSL